MDNVLIQENAGSSGNCYGLLQRMQADFSTEHIDELKILMPMHHPKARRLGYAVPALYVQAQVGEIGLAVKVDGIQILILHVLAFCDMMIICDHILVESEI